MDGDLPLRAHSAPLEDLQGACPAALVIVLISHLDARQQAAILAAAVLIIRKGEMPESVADPLRTVAASISVQ